MSEHSRWDKEAERILAEVYPHIIDRYTGIILGISKHSVQRKARKMGLKKTQAFLDAHKCVLLVRPPRKPKPKPVPQVVEGPAGSPPAVKYWEPRSRGEAAELGTAYVRFSELGARELPRCPTVMELLEVLQGSNKSRILTSPKLAKGEKKTPVSEMAEPGVKDYFLAHHGIQLSIIAQP